jgi:hypothetical protein
MGTGTLSNRSSGQVILDTFFNDIHSAMNGDFVGRNSSGVPTSGQNLGTAAIPWGTLRCTGLVINGSSVDTSQITSESNRVISGKERSTSNQPAFITPNGAAASFILYASATNLLLNVNGTAVTVNTDITKSSLTTAPAANNTCLIDDVDAADQAATRTWGEYGVRKELTVDTMGTEISNIVGKRASFKLDNGTATEYFHAFVESSTKLSRAYRGAFYDSSLNPKNRIVFSNNDTITLLKTGHVFVENNGTTVDVSYNWPVYGYTSPSSPATGDYWYDMANQLWKRYDGASFVSIARTYVGMVVLDSTNCIGAKCEDFYAKWEPHMAIELECQSTEIIRAKAIPATAVHVSGALKDYSVSQPTWNITTDLANSADMYDATEQASRLYHLYITDEGDTVISDIEPHLVGKKRGWYHPHNPWRAVGFGYNNGSSNLVNTSARDSMFNFLHYDTGNGHGAVSTRIRRFTNERVNVGCSVLYSDNANTGGAFTVQEAGVYTVVYNDGGGALVEFGLSLNTSTPTTSISSVTYAQGMRVRGSAANTVAGCTTWTGWLYVGDVVRAHTDGGPNVTDTRCAFSIQKAA